MLTGEPRESIFKLISTSHADPTKPITTLHLPKHVIMDSAPSEMFQYYSHVVDKSHAVTDSRQVSVSGGGGYGPFKGSFSYESKTVNTFKTDRNTKIVRTHGKVIQNKYHLQTYDLNMTDGFRNRIFEICNYLDKDTHIANAYATILTDEVIRFFGTHVVSSITTGGMLIKIDSVDATKYETDSERSMSASASASFGSYFHVKGSIQTEHTDVAKYSSALVNSAVQTVGGEWHTANWTYDNWLASLKASPAVVEMHADYILDYVRGSFFREVEPEKLLRVRALMEDRLNVYLENNIYKSCNDPSSADYIVYANVYSAELCKSVKTFHFGGMYTTSDNDNYAVKNILTEAYTCPAGYQPKKFLDLSFNQAHPYQKCSHFLFWKWCHTEYYYTTIKSDTFVCHSTQNQTQGMFFGGIYTPTIANDFTQNKNCPSKYIGFPIYHDASKTKTMMVCMAPFDSGDITALPFGGIFTSQEPNAFLGDYETAGSLTGPYTCPNGFERHPIQASPIAEVTYCIKTGSLNQKIPDIKPPGYGTSYADMLDFYPIHKFDNGTNVGIAVNPAIPDNYNAQVMHLAINTVGRAYLRRAQSKNALNTEKVDTNQLADTQLTSESYLAQWADANGIHHYLAQMTGFNNKHYKNENVYKPPEIISNVDMVSESSDHKDTSSTWIVLIIVGIAVTILLIGGIVIMRRRRRKSGYGTV